VEERFGDLEREEGADFGGGEEKSQQKKNRRGEARGKGGEWDFGRRWVGGFGFKKKLGTKKRKT
jgi:hypothetical protein